MIKQGVRVFRQFKNILISVKFPFTDNYKMHPNLNKMNILDNIRLNKYSKVPKDPKIINEFLLAASICQNLNFLDICEIIRSINIKEVNNETVQYIDTIVNKYKSIIKRQNLHNLQKIVFSLIKIDIKNEFVKNCFAEAIKKCVSDNFSEYQLRDILATFCRNKYYHSQDMELFSKIIQKIVKKIDNFNFNTLYFVSLDIINFIEDLDKDKASQVLAFKPSIGKILNLFDEQFESKFKSIPTREYAGVINIFAKANLKRSENWSIISDEIKKNINEVIINKDNMNKLNNVLSAFMQNLEYFNEYFYEDYIIINIAKLKFNNISLIIYTFGLLEKGSQTFWMKCEEAYLKVLDPNDTEFSLHAFIGFANSPFFHNLSRDLWKSFNNFFTNNNLKVDLENANLINLLKAVNKITVIDSSLFDTMIIQHFFDNITYNKSIHEILKIYSYLPFHNIILRPEIKENVKIYLQKEDFCKIPEIKNYLYKEFLVNCMDKLHNHLLKLIVNNDISELINIVFHIVKRRIMVSNECVREIKQYLTFSLERSDGIKKINNLDKKRLLELFNSNFIEKNKNFAELYLNIFEDIDGLDKYSLRNLEN
jgi:hypothetical protein